MQSQQQDESKMGRRPVRTYGSSLHDTPLDLTRPQQGFKSWTAFWGHIAKEMTKFAQSGGNKGSSWLLVELMCKPQRANFSAWICLSEFILFCNQNYISV